MARRRGWDFRAWLVSALALATLLAFGGNARADGLYSRGDANCDVTHSAADVAAEVRALGGASVCSNDDSDRDGSVTAADLGSTAGCLFGPCPVPPSAPHVTTAASDSAPTIAPFTAIRVTGTNLGPEDGLKRVTIGGQEAVVADVIDANTLEVVVPGNVPPGPAEVVVFNGDFPGFPFAITVAAPTPVGTPDTFDGTLDLVDTLVALMLATDIESAFGDNAAVLREGLQRFRTDLAAQRAALAADPSFTAEVRARLDAAFDGSGVPEMLRQRIAEIEELLASSSGQGTGAAGTIVGIFARGEPTIKVVRAVAVAAGEALALPAAGTVAAIALAAGVVTGLVGVLVYAAVSNPPAAPLLLALAFADASGASRPYPTVGGSVQVEAERFDPNSVRLAVERSDRGEDLFAPRPPLGDRFLTFQLNDPTLCGQTRFRLNQQVGGKLVDSNAVWHQIQPELLDVDPKTALVGNSDLSISGRGLGPWTSGGGGKCYASLLFKGPDWRDWRESELELFGGSNDDITVPTTASVFLPTMKEGAYKLWLRVEGVYSNETLPLSIRVMTGLELSCDDADLEAPPSDLGTTKCHATALPKEAGFPLGSRVDWTTSDDSVEVRGETLNGPDADVAARHPGTASIRVSLTIARRKFTSNPFVITVTDEMPPGVTLLSDSPSSVKPGDAIVVKVKASDNVGLSKIGVTAEGDAVLNASQETACGGEKACEATYTISLKDKDFTENEVTITGYAEDTSQNREESDERSFTIQPQADTTCPQVTIKPADGSTVNAGSTVEVEAKATDNGANDTGVASFDYSASGDALSSPVSGYVPLAPPQGAPTLRFTFTVKNAADLVSVTDKTITISVEASDAATPPNTCPQTITVTAIGTLDQCDGGISADPQSGYDGDTVTITVVISGPAADRVHRVTTINPGGQFDLEDQGNGTFQITLYYGGQGSFTMTFTAYDDFGDPLCSGSIGLTALGPRPGIASVAAGSLRQLPAGVTAGAAQPRP